VTGTSVLGVKYADGIMLAADTLGEVASLLETDLLTVRADSKTLGYGYAVRQARLFRRRLPRITTHHAAAELA
jgi:hypothetical protein